MTVSEIVAVVIGSVVAGLVLLAGIGFVIFKRWCARQPGEDIDPEEADHLQTGYVSQVGYAPQMGYVQQPPYNPGATENTPSTYTVPALYSSNTAFPRHASA
ncbi:hypothetical protein LPJ61_005616 [Coemansia biformis]|uniref:Uncharacterized protein n=1 Tax=Coemansia biformis TaxID=1286918 RepID=A0A9W7Y8T2_9FUNG|nr:hypothetical protein LPJ61_005616 [Coemansia biformis]